MQLTYSLDRETLRFSLKPKSEAVCAALTF